MDHGNGFDTDDILRGKGYSNHVEAAEAAALQRLQKLHDTINGLEEYTSEKRSAKRESLLRRLFRTLTNSATGLSGQDMVMDHQDTIRTVCFHSIRVGQPTEQYAACRILEATSVILGSDQEQWVDSINKQLRRLVGTSKVSAIRSAALRALSMAVIINSDDSHDTESLMDFCEEFAAPVYRNEIIPPSFRASAIDCWSLLATTIDDFYLSGQDDDHIGRGLVIIPLLKDCLETTEASMIDLREAAGECVALIHEARLNIGIVEHDEIGETNVTTRKYQRGSWENSQVEDIIEEIKIRIDELSNQTGHYLNKHVKKEIRKTFREILATVSDNESPEETLYFNRNNISLTLKTWKEIIQLEFVRHCFQGGFQIQLLTNTTLQVMFGLSSKGMIDPNPASTTYSQLEKRLYLSKTSETSKLADKKLNKDRKKRTNIKNHFLTVDED